MIIFSIDSTIQEERKFVDLCYKFQEELGDDCQKVAALRRLAKFSKNFHREFNASRFLKIDKTIIFGLFSKVATYYIITNQLNESQYQKFSQNFTG